MQRNEANPFESSLSGAAATSFSTSAVGDRQGGDDRFLPSSTQAEVVRESDADDDHDDIDAEGSSEEQTVQPAPPPKLESLTSGEVTESSASSGGGGGAAGGSSSSSSAQLSGKGSSFLNSYRSKKRQLSDNGASDAGIFLSPASTSVTSKISCLECRTSKTRCSGGEPCQRCKRLGRECVYKEHRRGRFSDSKRVQHLERTVQTLMGQLRALQTSSAISPSAPTPASSSSSRSTGPGAPSLLRNVSSATPSSSSSSDGLHRDGASSSLFKTGASTSSSRTRSDTSSFSSKLPITKLLSHPLQLLSRAGLDIQARRSNDASSNTSAFLVGISEPLHDHFDPIDMDVIRLGKADALFRLFFDRIEPNVMLFDPALHSFDYVRSRSSLLLSAICFIAALFDEGSAQLSLDLEAHIYHLILPEVITESYRSIEIAQALLLLALYHPAAETMVVGRSYQFIGLAEQIALELNLNRAQQVKFASDASTTTLAGGTSSDSSAKTAAQELDARHVRNAERTWLGIWTGEMILSERMGRAPLVRADSSVLSSASWHNHPLALSSDSTIVCIVQMHLIVSRQLELGERIVFAAQPNVVPTIETTIQLFWKSGLEQLDAWLSVWAGSTPANVNVSSAEDVNGGRRSSSSSSSAGTRANAAPTSAAPPLPGGTRRPSSHQATLVFSRAKLDYWYARVLFATRGLRLPFENNTSSLQRELYRDAFHSGMAYIQIFLQIVVPDGLTYGHDGVVIAPVYVMVVCLHILASMPDSVEQWNVDVESVFSRVQELIDSLGIASNASAHRRGVAGKLMPLLGAILNEVQDSIRNTRADSKKRRSSSQFSHVGGSSAAMKHDVPQSSSTNLAGLQTPSQPSTTTSNIDWSRDEQGFAQYLSAVAEQNLIPPLSGDSAMQAMMSSKHPAENQQEMDYNMAMADPRAGFTTQTQVHLHPSQQLDVQALWPSDPGHRTDATQTHFFGQSGIAQASASGGGQQQQEQGSAADPALLVDPRLHSLLFGTPFNVQGQQLPLSPPAQSPPGEQAPPAPPPSSSS